MALVVHDESALATRMLVKRPQEAFSSQFLVNVNWQKENWHAQPDFNGAAEEHFHLCRALKHRELAVAWQPEEYVIAMDSIYTRDAVLMTPAGAIACSLRKTPRLGETEEVIEYLEQLGVTTVGAIEDEGMLSGGDCVWLEAGLLLVALSEHTNEAGVLALRKLFSEHPALQKVEIITADMVKTNEVIAADPAQFRVRTHLHSCLSPLGSRRIVVCPERVPDTLIVELKKRKFDMLAVSLEEWNEFAAEIFMLKPTKGYMASSSSAERVKEFVWTKWKIPIQLVKLDELSKGRGGIKALILPFERTE